MNTMTNSRTRPTAGIGRLVRRLERERRQWTLRDHGPDSGRDMVATEQAWRAGVAEGLRLAQTAIRRGV